MVTRKTTTSTEVKERWKAKTYKRYTVNLRLVEDKDLINFVEKNKESNGVSDYFRIGVEKVMNGE